MRIERSLGERPGWVFWTALPLMAIGFWLHLTEGRSHWPVREQLAHAHRHSVRAPDFAWEGTGKHTAHPHEPVVHTHTPDVHHRHEH